MANLRQYSPRGQYDMRIVIQQGVAETDSLNQEVITWTDYKSKWTKVMYRSGGEKEIADRETAFTRIIFEVRYDADLFDKKLRIMFRGQPYDLTLVQEVPRKRAMHLHTIIYE